ncbi:MAG: hypothetical protein KC553_04130 [Nitrospina sp.]|nr:hypothetical protein [Nitrospina sp.]
MEPQNYMEETPGFHGASRKARGILIAVQDPVLGSLLGRFLEKEGHVFELADSWQGVLETFRGFQPEAVVLGVLENAAPAKDRVDAIRQLAGEERLPVLVLSAEWKGEGQHTIPLQDPLNWEELGRSLKELSHSRKGRNALLINPDTLFNLILAKQFERMGWRATPAPHVQSAKYQINLEKPDLIFMETQTGMNDILSVLRTLPAVPLFLLETRKLKREDEARLAEFDCVIFRPGQFSLKELKEALDARMG